MVGSQYLEGLQRRTVMLEFLPVSLVCVTWSIYLSETYSAHGKTRVCHVPPKGLIISQASDTISAEHLEPPDGTEIKDIKCIFISIARKSDHFH